MMGEGEVVVVDEHVTGLAGRDAVRALAAYRVRDGRIASVWYLR
jgi:hypothetical protein